MSKSTEKVCIFIDDSNLFIEGMKFMAKQNHLVVKQDHRFRIEFSELINVLAKNRNILCKKLYGSGSWSNSPVWTAMKEEGIQPKVFDRSAKGREKEVDSTLVADVVDKAACLRFEPPRLNPGSVTFIIVSGDRDYLEALRKVHKHGWKLEVVCWESAISERVRNFVRENRVKGTILITLDYLVERNSSFYFVEARWSTPSEGDRACYVFKYNCPQKEEDAKRLSFKVVNLIKRPCQYLRPDNDPRMIKIVMLVEYKNQFQIEADTRNMITAFQHGTCHHVSLTKSKIDQNEDADDDDDNEGSVEERCAYKFSCRMGKTCQHRHTRAEKEHFEINSQHLGAKYKSRMCRAVQGRRCPFMSSPRKCPWAHGLTDARCYVCDIGGLRGDHWMDKCPKRNHRHEVKQQINLKALLQKLTNCGQSFSFDENELFGVSDDSECDSVMISEDSEYGSEL